MKKHFTFFPLLLLALQLDAQLVNPIYGDTVKIVSLAGPGHSVLMIDNSTNAVKGFLYNNGRGVTVFRHGVIKVNDSTYIIGSDTLFVKIPSGADLNFAKNDLRFTGDRTHHLAGHSVTLDSAGLILMKGYTGSGITQFYFNPSSSFAELQSSSGSDNADFKMQGTGYINIEASKNVKIAPLGRKVIIGTPADTTKTPYNMVWVDHDTLKRASPPDLQRVLTAGTVAALEANSSSTINISKAQSLNNYAAGILSLSNALAGINNGSSDTSKKYSNTFTAALSIKTSGLDTIYNLRSTLGTAGFYYIRFRNTGSVDTVKIYNVRPAGTSVYYSTAFAPGKFVAYAYDNSDSSNFNGTNWQLHTNLAGVQSGLALPDTGILDGHVFYDLMVLNRDTATVNHHFVVSNAIGLRLPKLKNGGYGTFINPTSFDLQGDSDRFRSHSVYNQFDNLPTATGTITQVGVNDTGMVYKIPASYYDLQHTLNNGNQYRDGSSYFAAGSKLVAKVADSIYLERGDANIYFDASNNIAFHGGSIDFWGTSNYFHTQAIFSAGYYVNIGHYFNGDGSHNLSVFYDNVGASDGQLMLPGTGRVKDTAATLYDLRSGTSAVNLQTVFNNGNSQTRRDSINSGAYSLYFIGGDSLTVHGYNYTNIDGNLLNLTGGQINMVSSGGIYLSNTGQFNYSAKPLTIRNTDGTLSDFLGLGDAVHNHAYSYHYGNPSGDTVANIFDIKYGTVKQAGNSDSLNHKVEAKLSVGNSDSLGHTAAAGWTLQKVTTNNDSTSVGVNFTPVTSTVPVPSRGIRIADSTDLMGRTSTNKTFVLSTNKITAATTVNDTLPNKSGTFAMTTDITNYVDSPEHVYSDSITFTGTTAPSGTKYNYYRWTKSGKVVTFSIKLEYSTIGTAVTAAVMRLPLDAPTPIVPTLGSGAVTNIYTGAGAVYATVNAAIIGGSNLRMRKDGSGWFELVFTSNSTTALIYEGTITYFTNQ